jgi:uncharacterized protein (TIGR03083 family)
MTEQGPTIDDQARSWARTANEAFGATAQYLRSLPEDAWDGPSGCAKWTIQDLAGHVVGEAVWFPNLVRGVTRGEAPLPTELYDRLKTLPPAELTERMEEAANAIEGSIVEATEEHLRQTVDMGFARMPLWRATFVSALEAVYHNWDARAGREARPTIPTPWAVQLGREVSDYAPLIAHRDKVAGSPGTYLLQVGDGIGPMTVTAQDGGLEVERGAVGRPDVTLHLTADQCARLVAGRLDLASDEGRELQIEGDRSRAAGLNRIFAGIANN